MIRYRSGDKVVCIDNSNTGSPFISGECRLTIGKIYDVLHYANGSYEYYLLNNDNGSSVYYDIKHFIGVSEYRNIIIKEILE